MICTFWIVLNRFDVLMSKIIFKKWKNIIDIYFGTKSYLKNTRNHTIIKHAWSRWVFGIACYVWKMWFKMFFKKKFIKIKFIFYF
jgi:hypothetical protein